MSKSSLALCLIDANRDIVILERYTQDQVLEAREILRKRRIQDKVEGKNPWNTVLLPFSKGQAYLGP